MKKYWDHSTKPSCYVIRENDIEVFRGTYDDGMMYIRSLQCSGMISFKNDYIPAMEKLRKHCQNGYALEKDLRRQIIKLKKEIKSLTSD